MKTTMRTAVGTAVAALTLAACTSTGPTVVHGPSEDPATSPSSAAAQPAARGVEAPIASVPWSQVGPGWTLATWSPVTGAGYGDQPRPGEPTPQTAATTLYLVDPAGGRYAISTFPAPGENHGLRTKLFDWSGDGRRALLEEFDSRSDKTTMIDFDLATGARQSFTLDGHVVGAYTRPTGKAILLSRSAIGDLPAMLKRVDLTGAEQLTYPIDQLGDAGKFNDKYLDDQYLAAPDGTHLVLGAANGMAVMGNDGVLGRHLSVPGQLTRCSPVRWWTSSVILANCRQPNSSSASQLWQVPLDGGAPTPLTAVNSGQGDDPGFDGDIADIGAWQLPSGTFIQSVAGCGAVFLSRLTPDMHTTRVDVPGVDNDSVFVEGATADKLVLQADLQAEKSCGSGVSLLLTYDPATNTADVLLGGPLNGGGVIEVVPYPGQE